MPDIILPNLGLELPDVGSDQDTWGDILNANLEILDNAVTYDAITKTLGAVDVTLTTAEAAHGVINLNGTLTANVNLIVPVSPVRLYLVNNGTTGAFTVTVKTPLGTGVVVNQGANTLVYSNGTNIVQGATSVNGSFAAGTVNAGTLNVSGAASFAAGTAALPSITRTGDTNTGVYFPAADTVGISTASSERLRIDSAGNAGLGVTPSAWRSIERALDIGNSGSLTSASLNTRLYNNSFVNSSDQFIYKATGFAQYLALNSDGGYSFNTAPSGTAGNPITFTQAMTLTNGGNLLLGTTSDISSKINIELPSNGVAFNATNNTNASISLRLASGTGTFHVGGTGNMVFANGAGITERARITSGGYFKASNTGSYGGVAGISDQSTSARHVFQTDANDINLFAIAGSTSAGVINFLSSLATGATGSHFEARVNNVAVCRVEADGDVRNTNNSYGAISDAKLKENVVDASSYLDRFMQVRFRNFNFIGSDLKQFGVIAQELETVFPGLVEETPDFEQVTKTRTVEAPAVTDEEGNELTPATIREEEYTESVPTGTVTKSVKYSVLALMAGKVIQEQQEIIQAQQAQIDSILIRLAALEAK